MSLPEGTEVKVEGFVGVVRDYSHCESVGYYGVQVGSVTATVPSDLVSEIFTGEDTAVYKDGNGDVFVFYTTDNMFRSLLRDGVPVIAQRYHYEDLVKPVRKMEVDR